MPSWQLLEAADKAVICQVGSSYLQRQEIEEDKPVGEVGAEGHINVETLGSKAKNGKQRKQCAAVPVARGVVSRTIGKDSFKGSDGGSKVWDQKANGTGGTQPIKRCAESSEPSTTAQQATEKDTGVAEVLEWRHGEKRCSQLLAAHEKAFGNAHAQSHLCCIGVIGERRTSERKCRR